MPTFKQKLVGVRSARRSVEESRARLYAARLKVQRERDPTSLAAVRTDLAAALDAVRIAERGLADAIVDLHGRGDFRATVKELSADFPVVLLPVRIETRFVTRGERQELLVRIYPDDIHVHNFEARLTEAEVAAGRAYWSALARANREAGADAEDAKRSAWQTFARIPGVQRGLWIAKQTQPANWTPTLAVADDALEFPDPGPAKPLDWTRAPQTQVFPDRFVVRIHRGGAVVAHRVGRPVPDTVFLGPDPFLAEDAFRKTGKTIRLDESFAWVSDFNKAVAAGLGFRIALTPQMLNHDRIDRISVLGVMVSADPAEGQRVLEEHIRAHRYSRKGFSLLAQGTPTNNTDRSDSAWTRNFDDPPGGYYDGTDGPPLAGLADSDGLRLATVLGIDPETLAGIRNAAGSQAAEARAMNRALYPATVGHFLEVLSEPVIPPAAQDGVRAFFTEHVSATGPAAAVRVGDQPYGVLVTSDLGRWSESERDQFHAGLANVLRALQARWDDFARRKVPHVNKPGDASRLLLEILGLSAGSVSFRQRLAHLDDLPMSAANVGDVDAEFAAKQGKVMTFLRTTGYAEAAFPLISAISLYRDRSHIPARHLVDRKNPSPTRFLDRLGPRKLNFIDWLAQVGSTAELESHALPGAKPPRSVLYFLLRHSMLLLLQKAAVNFYRKGGFDFARGALEKSLHNFDTQTRDLTGWEMLRGRPDRIDPQGLAIDRPLGDHLLALPVNAAAVRELAELRRALNDLARLSTGRLFQALVDHLDLCSYRLDAWQTGLFSRRLLARRKSKPQGAYLGAYGWVENVRIEPKRAVELPEALRPPAGQAAFELAGNAGFVHTPSLNHATAAGLLLAGYRNNADASDPDAYAVNLSSERVRRALHLYQGVQNDQPIEALLGYQFERDLHESTTRDPAQNLNQYVLALREAFPIEGASVPQAGSEAQESVPVYPVVNGLKLVGATDARLAELGVAAAHRPLLRRHIDRLEDSLDAIGDLLTSEAAYQMVQGKADRTAGLLNSLQDAAVPPELEFTRTPRTTQLTVSNRLCLAFTGRAGIPAGSGWGPRLSPRARMESALNSWLAGQLGDPKRVVCSVALVDAEGATSRRRRVRLSDLGLQPIDFVHAVGVEARAGARELERLVYRHYAATVEVPEGSRVAITFSVDGLPGNQRSFAELLPLASDLRRLVTTARPGHAMDFQPALPKDERPMHARYGWDVAELDARVDAAIAELEAVEAALASKSPNARQPKTRANPATFREFFDAFEEDGRPVEMLRGLHLTPSSLDAIGEFLAAAPQFGLPVSAPEAIRAEDPEPAVGLLAAAAAVRRQARARIATALAKQAAADGEPDSQVAVKRLVEAAKAVLGDDFQAIPGFFFSNAADVRASLEQRGRQLLKHCAETYGTTPALALETWLQQLAPVRESVGRLERVRTIAEFTGGEALAPVAIQLPFRAKDHWFATELPALDPQTGEPVRAPGDTRTVCVFGLHPADAARRQQVLVLDDWTEAIPGAKEVTGIAYHYNQPNATAPNAVLVAVDPDGGAQWSWEALAGVLDDTLRRAKSRAVEPAHLLEDPALDVLTPMTLAGFDVHESNISLDYLATNDELLAKMREHDFRLYTSL